MRWDGETKRTACESRFSYARLLHVSLFEGILTLCDVSVKTPRYWAGTVQ